MRNTLRASYWVIVLLVAAGGSWAQVPIVNGWPQVQPSIDSRIACVDWITGSDANPGTMAAPYKTIAKGSTQLRDGFPDWLMLRNGSTWTETFPNWTKGGRSGAEPMVICGYGAGERPVLLCGTNTGISAGVFGPIPKSHLVLMDVWFQANTYNGANGTPTGVEFLGSWTDVTLANVRIGAPALGQPGGFLTNVVFQSDRSTQVMSDIRLVRCVITDAYRTADSAHAQGSFMAGIDRPSLIECFYDHNGWRDGHPEDCDIFRHNIYIQGHGGQTDDCKNATVIGTTSARAAGNDNQQRPGGIADNNLSIEGPWIFGTDGGTISNGVSILGRDINGANPYGVGVNPVDATAGASTIIKNYLCIGPVSSTNNIYGLGATNIRAWTLDHVVVWGWKNAAGQGIPVNFDGGSPAPTIVASNLEQKAPTSPVSFPEYMALLGAPPANRNENGYLAEVRKQSRANWRPEYTAASFNAWARSKFPGTFPQSAWSPNCDGSVTPPVVNVDDFACFLSHYGAESLLPEGPAKVGAYSNCDGSTAPPCINVADFSCFLAKYVAAVAAQGSTPNP